MVAMGGLPINGDGTKPLVDTATYHFEAMGEGARISALSNYYLTLQDGNEGQYTYVSTTSSTGGGFWPLAHNVNCMVSFGLSSRYNNEISMKIRVTKPTDIGLYHGNEKLNPYSRSYNVANYFYHYLLYPLSCRNCYITSHEHRHENCCKRIIID